MSRYSNPVEHRSVGDHESWLQKTFTGTGARPRNCFQAQCSCGWKGEYDRDDRGAAREERDAHLKDATP